MGKGKKQIYACIYHIYVIYIHIYIIHTMTHNVKMFQNVSEHYGMNYKEIKFRS